MRADGELDGGVTERQDRPTTDVSLVILDSMDRMFDQLIGRMAGITAEEFLWEPVEGMWSVRPDADGTPVVDGAGVREVDPAPVTTIAWRTWHLAIDCFDDYTRRFDGDDAPASPTWTLDPSEAIEALARSWHAYRGVLTGRDWWEQLGEHWGMWAKHSITDMAMHAGNELVHHGAEISLLRDLHRWSEHA